MSFYSSNPEHSDPTTDRRVSVVIITRNRGNQIRVALDHLIRLPEKPRIIVVDNNSSDGTPEIALSMGAPVEVISLRENLAGAGRNIGVQNAETPYVAFSDDDSWWAPGSLRHAADLFDAYPSLGLIAARMLIGPDARLDPLCAVLAIGLRDFRSESTVGVPVVGFAACGSIVRRAAFLEAGGFERRLGVGGEEHILALDLLRNGWKLAYVEGIVARHYPSPVRDISRRKRIEARNALWSAWLRRPVTSAFSETWRVVRLSFKDNAYRAGLAEAIAGLPWVISARDPVSTVIDDQVRIAERVFHNSLGSQ
ncbi:MAG TPA: glycosyltransferase [Anaerolineales bacterium]|nr:glycosyltransferase [Anaerolineales bacterium]